MAHTFRLPTALAAAAVIAALAACDDDPTGPDAFLDSAEAEAVMRSAGALPSVPGLIAAASATAETELSASLYLVQETWSRGAAMDGPVGAAYRRRAAADAAPALAELVPPEDWDAVQGRIEDWVGTAERMLRQLQVRPLQARLAQARVHLDRADSATSADRRVYHLTLAMADLVETTPRYVARTMVRDAEAAVRAAEARSGGEPVDRSLERARRLADWAARAAEEGDHLRAIQRAYYAIQLVEER